MRHIVVLATVVAALSIPSISAAQTPSTGWFASPFISGSANAPDFFEPSGFLTERRVMTVMGNAFYRFWTGGGAQAYAAGGAGLVRPYLAEAGDLAVIEVNKFGVNVGGGLIGHFSDHTGVRGDVRYVRTTGTSDADANPFGLDLTRFEFWRASAGLVVTF